MPWNIVLPSACAFCLYLNSIPADFAYDDNRAILKNPDVTGVSSITEIWSHDFWGTPITHSGSHKSYRPLCTLSFRLNHFLHGLNPVAFHTTNVVLHVIVTALFTWMLNNLVNPGGKPTDHDRKTSGDSMLSCIPLFGGILFASHPIHTEAVSGVVGRAEILCAIFFLLTISAYQKYCDYRMSNSYQRWYYIMCTALLSGGSLLCKEHGIMCIPVCVVYDFVAASKLRVRAHIWIQSQGRFRQFVEGSACLAVIFVCLFSLRIYVMGWTTPDFSPSDNPVADSKIWLERTLTFLYLPFFNAWLLLYPYTLSFDWSMDAVPLVSSFTDLRNLCSLTFYAVIIQCTFQLTKSLNISSHEPVRYKSRKSKSNNQDNSTPLAFTPDVVRLPNGYANGHVANGHANGCANGRPRQRIVSNGYHKSSSESSDSSPGYRNGQFKHRSRTPSEESVSHVSHGLSDCQLATFALGMLVLPFIPASNLVFYVGFVVAERVLYIPSMGFCVLVALGFDKMLSRRKNPRYILQQIILGLFWVLVALFCARTVVRNMDWKDEFSLYQSGVGVNPPKAWGNLGNIYSGQGKLKEAEQAYKKALLYRSNMADVHYNLGILLQEQRRYTEAIQSYRTAIQCRPTFTQAHLNLGIVLTALNQKTEAAKVYRTCADLDTSGMKDPRLNDQTKTSALYNLGRLLADQDQYQDAVQVYLEAIAKKPSRYPAQSLYNMLGEAYFKLDQMKNAEYWYREALTVKPDHLPAHLTMAKFFHHKNISEEAESWFEKALKLSPHDITVYQHYGQFLADTGRFKEAANMYQTASKMNPDDFEVNFNLANTLRQAGSNVEAERYYLKAVEIRPDDAGAHLNLGAMQHTNGHLDQAEQSYLTAMKLKPNDTTTQNNLEKLRAIKGRL